MINWISVEDQLPPDNTDIIVLNKWGGVFIGVYSKILNVIYTDLGKTSIDNYTHWAIINMPGE